MAQQMRALTELQATHARTAQEQQQALADKVEELARGLAATRAADLALARTTAKGATYEDQVHEIMAEIAAGLGDEYVHTAGVVGLRTRSKKGDGVLAVAAAEARLVVEVTDSPRGGWAAYLQEAEDNRGAQASLGLVRHAEQLPGGPILTLGPRRVVMVFDPEDADVHLLRCVVQMLRHLAVVASARVHSGELETADEKLAQAMDALERVAKIRKCAGQAQKSIASIDLEAEALQTELARLLNQARTALAGALGGTHEQVA